LIVLNRGEILAEGEPDAVRGREDVRAIYLGGGAHA
jgi:ABC-type branched-subunit amino acid transport system ATPase component